MANKTAEPAAQEVGKLVTNSLYSASNQVTIFSFQLRTTTIFLFCAESSQVNAADVACWHKAFFAALQQLWSLSDQERTIVGAGVRSL